MWVALFTRSILLGFFGLLLLLGFAPSSAAQTQSQSQKPEAIVTNQRLVVNVDKALAPHASTGSLLENPSLPIFKPPTNFTPAPSKPSLIPPTTPTDPSGPTCTPNKNGATCGGGGPAAQPKSNVNTGAGNPIDVITGNKYQLEVDLAALPGVLGVEVVRHYNSASAGPGTVVGMLGRGWRLSYETRLHVSDTKLQIVQADGTRIVFVRDPKKPSLCASSDSQKGWLVVNNNRPSNTRGDAKADTTYTWYWTNGKRLTFNSHGALIQILEPTGEFLTLQYDPAGRLLMVIDPSNRSLEFVYAPQSYRVASIKTPLGVIRYEPGQGAQADTLAGVLLPGLNTPKTYHYEDARWPNHLTGVSHVTRLSTYLYDEEGRGVLSTLGHPAKLAANERGEVLTPRRLAEGTGVEQVYLQYITRPTYTKDGVTVLTNALAQTTTFKHRIIAGEYRLIEARGAGCAQCGPVNRRYAYDEFGRIVSLQKIDREELPSARQTSGSKKGEQESLSFAYDELGRLATQTFKDRLGQAAQIKISYTGATHLVERVSRPSLVKGALHSIEYEYNKFGQPISVKESGHAPAIAASQIAARSIERMRKLQYKWVNGRSVLQQVFRAPNLETTAITFGWNSRGDQVLTVSQAGGQSSELKYDELGRVVQVRNQEGTVTQSSFNEAGLVSDVVFKVSDWPQELSSKTAGAQGNKFEQSQKFTYNERGQLIETKDTHGLAQAFGFDSVGRPQWHAQASGLLYQQWLNTESQVVLHGQFMGGMRRVIDMQPITSTPNGSLTQAGYSPDLYPRQVLDDFGRAIATVSTATGTTLREFDSADRLIGMQDAMGNKASYEYDLRGRIVRQRVSSADHAPTIETTWTYDGSRLVQVTHPTQSERFEYNALGQKTARHVFIHLGADGQNRQLPLLATTRYHYNDKSELTAVQWPDGSMLLHDRDLQGQLIAVKRSTVQTLWLRWLGREQTLVQNIERNLVGIRSYVAGNGLLTRYIRSQEGHLARVVHGWTPSNASNQTQLARKVAANDDVYNASSTVRKPVLDVAYLWDPRGNLLYQQEGTTKKFYAYDQWNQLLAAVESDSAPKQFWRYAYNDKQQRVLQQESTELQDDLKSGTEQALLPKIGEVNVNGQPFEWNGKQLKWDALGRLTDVTDANQKLIARYTYDHRGLRIAKHLPSAANNTNTEYMLYSETREPLAQLTNDGTIQRQYFYMAGLPLVAVEGGGHQLQVEQLSNDLLKPSNAFTQIWRDLKIILRDVWQGSEQVQFLHSNHLGAPQAVTNQSGDTIWRADYSPFGQATILKTKANKFTNQNLRLPGQWFDEETGLHYNRQRYYDPKQGRYLTPDPIGNPDGPNAYAYVVNNPLRFIDADGLVLFAFDGTGNTDHPVDLRTLGNGVSNVVLFRDLYQGDRKYITGVGTEDRSDPLRPIRPPATDAAFSVTGIERILRMVEYFNDFAELADDQTSMDVDIIGFSRGAAQARDFANLITQATRNGVYKYSVGIGASQVEKCQKVSFRFMGLWDTVLSNKTGSYNLQIPKEFGYVAHAVALNEYRGKTVRDIPGVPIQSRTGSFPLESIMKGSPKSGQILIERGFIGSHADIGGGFPDEHGESAISKVALSWMVQQAKASGISMRAFRPEVIANPVIHDKSEIILTGGMGAGEDREVRYLDTSKTTQRQMVDTGLTYAEIARRQNNPNESFITFDANRGRTDFITGTVNICRYLSWLRSNSYDIGNLRASGCG